MKQEDKELLLKDLCARLPYGVKCQIKGEEILEPVVLKSFMNCEPIFAFDFYLDENSSLDFKELGEFKPYLLPMSSMTEEQKRDLTRLFNCHVEITQYEIKFANYQDSNMDNWNKVFNWCYKNHFDINSLIPMGLANDATRLNIY